VDEIVQVILKAVLEGVMVLLKKRREDWEVCMWILKNELQS
jgi:hypothetical protein